MPQKLKEKELQNSIASRLKKIREHMGLTQEAMANAMGYKSYRSWQEYESSNRYPTFDVLQLLLEKGYSADWLITGQGTMVKNTQLSGVNMPLLIEAIADVRKEIITSDVILPYEKEAEIIAEIYSDALQSTICEVNHKNVVRFVRFAR